MKQTIAIAVLALFTSACSSAQKNKKQPKEKVIPSAVTEAFSKHFPNVKDVDWLKEDANFEAEFEQNEVETSVLMDPNGNILETESEIQPTALPKSVLAYVSTNHKGQKVKEAAKIVLADGTLQYEAEVKGKDLIFDANGVFIKVIAD